MKNINVFKSLTLLTIVFFVCALVPKVNAQDVPDVYDAKALAKKALTEGKIEVLELKMEKTTDKEGVGIIKITGTAIYTPAKDRKKSFSDIQSNYNWGARAYFYDAKGTKLKGYLGMDKFGENDQMVNVKYKEPFPFRGKVQVGLGIDQETFDKADYCIMKGMNTAKQVSSKDSK